MQAVRASGIEQHPKHRMKACTCSETKTTYGAVVLLHDLPVDKCYQAFIRASLCKIWWFDQL